MTQKATLHGIGEDAAQRSVHALNGVLGEWLFGFRADGFTELGVEGPEVLRPQLCELVVAQGRENADDVLLVSADGGLGQLAGGDLPQPQIDVGGQGDGLCSFLRGIPAGSLEEHRLFLEPFLPLLWRQFFGGMDGFLPGLDACALVVVAHGDHDEVAVTPFSDACHVVLTSLSLASVQLRPVCQTHHTERSRQKPSQLFSKPIFLRKRQSRTPPFCHTRRGQVENGTAVRAEYREHGVSRLFLLRLLGVAVGAL